MGITIQLKVKFRAFGVTVGTVAKQAHISIGTNGISVHMGNVTMPPPNAHKIVDERGVYLVAWI